MLSAVGYKDSWLLLDSLDDSANTRSANMFEYVACTETILYCCVELVVFRLLMLPHHQ